MGISIFKNHLIRHFLFQALLTTVFIFVGDIKTLIEFASWFLWFFYGLAMVALLVLRKTQATKLRPYRVPTLVPCFVLVVAIFLSVVPVAHEPSLKYLMAVGFMLMGVIVYTVFVYYKKTPTALLSEYEFHENLGISPPHSLRYTLHNVFFKKLSWYWYDEIVVFTDMIPKVLSPIAIG